MGTTPNYDLVYPETSDPADGSAAFQSLAESAESALQGIEGTGVPASSARGLVVIKKQTVNTPYTTMPTDILDTSFVALSGRRYRVTLSGVFGGNGSTRVTAYIHAGFGSQEIRNTGAFDIPVANFYCTGHLVDTLSFPSGGGLYTVRGSYIRGYAQRTGSVSAIGFTLTVEDIGQS